VSEAIINLDGSAFQPQPVPRLTPAALRRARLLLGWSQVDRGQKVKLSCTSISQFECGRTKLRPKNERKLLDVFAKYFVDVEGGAIRLRVPRRLAAAE
jgi:transcriptional regulator with XRE-family HTH domain